MKLYIDMIAFYLQRAGGITSVWKELIIRMLEDGLDVILILQNVECKNIYFNHIMELAPNVIYEKGNNVRINRYLPIRCHMEKGSKFFSTYYRISTDRSFHQYVIVHDFTYEHYVKGIRKLVHSWQKKTAVKCADAIVCVSENTKKDLLQFYPWARKKDIYVIYNGVSGVYRPCYDIEFIEELDKYNDIPFLLYVGSRAVYKRFDFAVRMAKKCGYRLVIIGGGELNKEEIALLNEGVKDNYLHISELSDEKLNLVYNKAFALIYPSEYEGFGLPIIEAQRAGCPVITCKGSSISEIVKEELLIENYSWQEVLKLVSKLESEEKRKVICLEGFANAEKYSWEKAYDQYKKALRLFNTES